MLLAMGIGVVSIWAIGSSWKPYPAHSACGIKEFTPQAPDIGPPPPGYVAEHLADNIPDNCLDVECMMITMALPLPDGGRAVWQARSILRYGYETWYEEEGCIAPLYGGSEPELPEAVSPQWMVYPNPAQGDGWILHRGDGTVQLQSVRVLDATGRIIWQARGATEGDVSPYLPGGLWAPGVYYIEIQTARGRETMTWMIKR